MSLPCLAHPDILLPFLFLSHSLSPSSSFFCLPGPKGFHLEIQAFKMLLIPQVNVLFDDSAVLGHLKEKESRAFQDLLHLEVLFQQGIDGVVFWFSPVSECILVIPVVTV